MNRLVVLACLLCPVLISAQRGFGALHEEMNALKNPTLNVPQDRRTYFHVGIEKFMTKFPGAPIWSSIGVYLPSHSLNAAFSFYLRYAEQGILRHLIPAIGYSYKVTIDRKER